MSLYRLFVLLVQTVIVTTVDSRCRIHSIYVRYSRTSDIVLQILL